MSIIQRQELPGNIDLLAAQRSLYSRAKRIVGFQMVISGPVAICAAITSILKPELKGYVALWGILALVFDLFVFTPWVKKLRENAARVQELFDTRVLALDWSDIAVGKKPDSELVQDESRKYGFDEKKRKSLSNWYPVIIDTIPEAFGVIICQRANLWWDCRMRRQYSLFIRSALVFIALALVAYGLYEKKDMFEFLAYIVAPLASTYVLGYRQMMEHSDAADRLEKLKDVSEKLWSEAVSGKEVTLLNAKSRALQDQIFDHRKRNPPVFDFLFKWFRDVNENLMNKGAEDLVMEVKK